MPLKCGFLRSFALIGWYYEQNLMMGMIMSDVLILGEPTDYYNLFTKDDGSIHYQGNRTQIREMMKIRSELIDKCIANGDVDGISKISNDYSDAFEIFILNEPEEAKIAVYNMMAEEMNALADKLNRITDETYREIDEKNAFAENIGAWIGAAILFIFILFMFSR
ncbi:hypothetical protein KKJ21_15035 [Xenorhabdus bovienii]|uniref:hypothetical protein n=1 Tax=Xenorhabdus bovienii TaxID=40576 RepID=UPI0023B0AC13|nr:hypothetical protein [Xenorhabdus bovienii]MDE9478427.1 hypothetical protein [Xenorhabdus bovienii]